MGIRLYSDAIKSDPSSRLVINAGGDRVTATALPQNEPVWLAWDDGAGFYAPSADKNVHAESNGIVTPANNNSRYSLFALADTLAGEKDCRAGEFITVSLNKSSGGIKSILLSSFAAGVSVDTIADAFDYEATQFWHKFEIDWTAETLTVTFYTNVLRTITAFTPKVISITGVAAMRYMYGIQGFNFSVAGGGVSGYTENFVQLSPSISGGASRGLIAPPIPNSLFLPKRGA